MLCVCDSTVPRSTCPLPTRAYPSPRGTETPCSMPWCTCTRPCTRPTWGWPREGGAPSPSPPGTTSTSSTTTWVGGRCLDDRCNCRWSCSMRDVFVGECLQWQMYFMGECIKCEMCFWVNVFREMCLWLNMFTERCVSGWICSVRDVFVSECVQWEMCLWVNVFCEKCVCEWLCSVRNVFVGERIKWEMCLVECIKWEMCLWVNVLSERCVCGWTY